MPIWLGTVNTRAEEIVVKKLPNGDRYTISSGDTKWVNMEVGSDGIQISWKDRDMIITDSDYKLTFTEKWLTHQIVLTIINTWFQGAASFDVERGPQHFKIVNTDERLYHKDDTDAHGDHPKPNYYIMSEKTNLNTGEEEQHWAIEW